MTNLSLHQVDSAGGKFLEASPRLASSACSSRPLPAPGALPGEWSRRGFLGALAALTAGTLSGCWAAGPDPQAIGGSDPQDTGGPAATPKPGEPSLGKRVEAGPTTASPPYQFGVQAELSEDYFLVVNHQIDPTKDKVVAYSRADGQVEGVLLQDGVIKQLYRDPTQPGGWSAYKLFDATNVTDMVAGVSGPVTAWGQHLQDATLRIFWTSADHAHTLWIATENAGPTRGFTVHNTAWGVEYVGNVASYSNPGPLHLAVNADNTLLVTGLANSTKPDQADACLFYYQDGFTWNDNDGNHIGPASGSMKGFTYYPLGTAGPGDSSEWVAVVARPNAGLLQPTVLLYLPGPAAGVGSTAAAIWLGMIPIGTTQSSTMEPWAGPWGTLPQPPSPTATIMSFELATTLGDSFEPTLVVRTRDRSSQRWQLWVLSRNDKKKQWFWTELTLPAAAATSGFTVSTALEPVPATEKVVAGGVNQFLDVFVLAGQTLSVIRQAPTGDTGTDGTNPAYTPPIPLDQQVALMTSQAGESRGNELLLVATDATLRTLEKDPVSGRWTDAIVHLPASEMEQVTSYRVQLTLSDQWNMPVTSQPVQITASTPVNALIDGKSAYLSQASTSVSTDPTGQIVLALPADGLSAPTLTLTTDGLPSPATIHPSEAVNTYMRGQGSLNYLDPMSSSTLQNAKTSQGKVLAPGASSATAAADAVKTMNTATGWAADGVTAGLPSWTLGRIDGGRGKRTRGRRSLGKSEIRGFVDDLDSWAHDALYAIKKGVAGVASFAIDAEKKTISIGTDVADWAGKEIQIVVQGIEDAAHVLHAIFNKILADIEDVIDWIKAEVLGVLLDTIAVAQLYEGWIEKSCSLAVSEIGKNRGAVDQWLATEREMVTSQITSVANRFKSSSLSGMGSSSLSRGGRSGPPPTLGSGDNDSSGDTHGDWLWSKIKNALGNDLDLPPIDGVDKVRDDLASIGEHVIDDFSDVFSTFKDYLLKMISHPSQIPDLAVSGLLMAISELVSAGFDLAQAVVDIALDLVVVIFNAIKAILAIPFTSALPVVGKLFSLAGIQGPTVGTVLCALFAFPAVVAYKTTHGGKGRPFADTSVTTRPRRLGDDETDALKICADCALAGWAFFDAISQAITAGKDKPPAILSLVDIGAPIMVGFFSLPATSGEPYFGPPVDNDPTSQAVFLAWLAGIVPAAFAGINLYLPDPEGKADPYASLKNLLLCMTSGCGGLSLAMGCIAVDTNAPHYGWDYASAVLNSMANIAAPLLDDTFVKNTDGISAGVACAITLGCGLMGAVAAAKGD